MNRLIVRSLIVIFGFFACILIIQVSRFYIFLNKGDYNITPYQQNPTDANRRILVLGDSTGIGTGSNDNHGSVAAYFGQDFPTAIVDNNSRNGRRIAQLLEEVNIDQLPQYDVIILQMGGNDILRFTPLESVKENLAILLSKVQNKARHVILLHSGNVGIAPIFIWPISDFLTKRTQEVRQIYLDISKQYGVQYIDLYQERRDDVFLKDIPKYYSPDLLHPSPHGYRFWYEQIRTRLIERGITWWSGN